jgi:hypothetical protein
MATEDKRFADNLAGSAPRQSYALHGKRWRPENALLSGVHMAGI